jgi:hypothetical protein
MQFRSHNRSRNVEATKSSLNAVLAMAIFLAKCSKNVAFQRQSDFQDMAELRAVVKTWANQKPAVGRVDSLPLVQKLDFTPTGGVSSIHRAAFQCF